jgi:chaperonin cofactor prefoldin
MSKKPNQCPVEERCHDCLRNKIRKCEALTEPEYFYKKYGECFAKVTDQAVVDKVEYECEQRGSAPEFVGHS